MKFQFKNGRLYCPYCEIPVSMTVSVIQCHNCSTVFKHQEVESAVREFDPQSATELKKSQQEIALALYRTEKEKHRLAEEMASPNLSLVDVATTNVPRWKLFASLFGIPVEEKEYQTRVFPAVSLFYVLLCFVLGFANERNILSLAFKGDDPFRHGGIHFITYAFVHGGWLHLLGNMFFIWPFLDNVEEHFGHFKTFLFIVFSAIASSTLHHVMTDSPLPLVGASGVCFGMATLYCCLFPKNRFLIAVPFLGLLAHSRRIRLRASSLFVYFILIEAWGILKQNAGLASNVSHWGHLGGALAGLVFFVFLRDRDI